MSTVSFWVKWAKLFSVCRSVCTKLICLLYPGLRGVSDLRYRSNDSTALWASSLKDHTAIAFLYELSLLNGTTLLSNRVSDTELHLAGLEDSKSYILDVWEQCGGQWESEHSRLCIEGTNSSLAMFMRAAGPVLDEGQLVQPYFWVCKSGEHLSLFFIIKPTVTISCVFCRAGFGHFQLWSHNVVALVTAWGTAEWCNRAKSYNEGGYHRKGERRIIVFVFVDTDH